ncbi:MAG: shikimate dehydrogenase, partial [Acidimicrobiales bacterium]
VAVVPGRRAAGAEAVAALCGPPVRPGTLEEVVDFHLVVNATSVGLGGLSVELALPVDRLGAGQLVVDINYPGGALVEAARATGAVARDGVGMLVHQAAAAFGLWTGVAAPLEAMWRGARSGLLAGAGPIR